MITTPRLRPPEKDGGVFSLPPLDDAPLLLEANRQRASETKVSLLGRPLADLRRDARLSAIATAIEYLQGAGEPLPHVDVTAPILMAGHQPELFHSGVWVKNFALCGLANAMRAVPFSFIVDNDTAKQSALRLPIIRESENSASRANPLVLPFDTWTSEIPFEERKVGDEDLFRSFANRAAEIVNEWGFTSLLPQFWAEVQRAAGRTPLLGERFAAARRVFERAWGCHNLEVPLSRLCQTQTFGWFASHILLNLNRFHAVHNQALAEYRRVNAIRSRSHPVPDLAAEGDWREAPFWIWRAGHPQRSRLLALPTPNAIELRLANEPETRLPALPKNNAGALTASLLDLERLGFKLRTRALTTTLYARLFLADLFIHGIGGAKYDELNDEIMRQFYEIEPPSYLILSATLLLPFRLPAARQEDERRLAHELRDLRFNPQRHISNGHLADPEAALLRDKKQEWIRRQPLDSAGRRERFQRLKDVTRQLTKYVTDQEHLVSLEQAACQRHRRLYSLLTQRDYAFCLFPESKLKPFCTQFLA